MEKENTMTDGPSMRPTERRLLRGYGPSVVLAAGFLLMTLTVPTVAPEHEVSASSPTNEVAPSSGTMTVGGASAGDSGASGNTPGATGGVAITTPSVAPPSGKNGNKSSPGAGGVASGGAGVHSCAGSQVANDSYSPPCISFSGDNGGATAKGVTSDTITISFRRPADGVEGIASLIGKLATRNTNTQFKESNAQIERTVTDLVTYFNNHFQFYGRKLAVSFWNGQGQMLTEVQNAGQAQAQADALHEADSIKPFAEVFALSQPFSEALSAQGIVNLGSPYMSHEFYQRHAPYAYSFFPNATDLGVEGGNLVVKQLCHKPVTWAGKGVPNGQERRFAVLVPDNPVYQAAARQAISIASAGGCAPTANLTYTLDLSQASQQAQSITQQIINKKITTIIEASDPIAPLFITGDLENANYEPEIFNLGAAWTDYDYVAQLFEQNVWAHAAGVTNGGAIPPYGSSIAYFAAKSVDPDNPPALEVDNYYQDLYMLAIGIQMAGPNLTAQTFQRGLFNYPGGSGVYCPWTLNVAGAQQFTPQHQFQFEWWNPNAVSKFNGSKGTYVVDPTWYTVQSVPSGAPPVMPPAGSSGSASGDPLTAPRREQD